MAWKIYAIFVTCGSTAALRAAGDEKLAKERINIQMGWQG